MKGRYLLSCIGLGSLLAAAMIYTHLGPGLQASAAKSTPQLRNTQRAQMLQDLASALTQYRRDHGHFPIQFATAKTQICISFGNNCTLAHLTDLSFLVTEGNYLPALPEDPAGGMGRGGSGYFIQPLSDGHISLSAPEAELGKNINLTFTP